MRRLSIIRCPRTRVLIASVVLTIIAFSGAAESASLSYNRDIRPIFSETCFKCHGPDEEAREGELRLDIREEAMRNLGGYFAIDPGNAEESEVVLRIFSDDPEERMPPPESGIVLKAEEREILERWIDEGAEYETHWAYLAPVRPELPQVEGEEWVRNPIDRFILARLEAAGLKPAPEADPVRLLRRLHFDLVGLPPTPKEVKAFRSGDPDARYAKSVTKLMRSRHYGERMAMEWLDVVRFADTNGYHSDEYRDMHPYRDYVIAAFNDNKPFDQFTIEQLAGDLLDEPTIEQKIASGYNRLNQITSEGGAQPGEYIAKYMADRVRNLGAVWMGATLGCIECHDHKFDPFLTKDFYRFGAFFADIKEQGKYEHGKYGYAPFLRFPTPKQQRDLKKLTRRKDALRADSKSAEDKKALRAAMKEVDQEIETLESSMASTLITEAVAPREIRVLPRGNWLDHSGDVVTARTPSFLPPLRVQGEGATRLDLARWLVSDENPMTARVFVNRLWEQFFGRGLSKVLDDFGNKGAWPSHPELLDWLAVEFRESGYDMKHIVRLIVASSTYRQSTRGDLESIERDPSNALYSRRTPQRLKAELVRDNILAIAGLLERDIGGPSVKPYQPEAYYDDTYASVGNRIIYTHDVGENQYRRGLYVFWRRSFLHPSLLAFDAPTREECTAGRLTSNTPQQALVLMNDPSYVEAAKALAARVVRDGGRRPEEKLAHAFILAVSREPSKKETELLLSLYDRHRSEYEDDRDAAKALLAVGLWEVPRDLDTAEVAAWTSVCRAILNMHETITRY